MILGRICLLAACGLLVCAQGTRQAARDAEGALQGGDAIKQGHSHQGAAFDEGPRAKPWEMDNIGSAPFPITHKNPETQKWFNQGNTLLHHFWDFEAERAFRWALKLEPENAMVYWGLARATGGERSKAMIREAVKRKQQVTERERLYIEWLEKLELTDTLRDRNTEYDERRRESMKVLETLCVKYPEDLEAKALLAYSGMGDSRYGTERIVQEILAANPNHPGAHHYRIHNWNYHEPEQALESCRRYGGIAPGSGHALHMPGHVYSTVGMWHEAAISMDAATRVEKQNMRERLTFPYNHWNYGHNRAYLCYIQEQLGMAEAAVEGARQLIAAPLDPKFNADNRYSTHSQGINSLVRAYVKFERWDDLLAPENIPWRDIFMDKMNRAYTRARGYLGQGRLDRAETALEEHAALKKDLAKNKQFTEWFEIQGKELRARLLLAKGETLNGLALLSEAAERQFEMQKQDNDPPIYAELLYNALGRAYLQNGSPLLAIKAFETTLTLVRNDIFALSGLVEAHAAMGDKKAAAAMERLLFTASAADPGAQVVEKARSRGIVAQPKDNAPAPQRNYREVSLERFGPALWEPFPAPELNAPGADGKPVTLTAHQGRNIILVFYLGRECLHCMNQLKDLEGKKEEWSRLDATVIALSPNKPEETREAAKNAKLNSIVFGSDGGHANARRFRSYDDFEEMEIHSTILIDKQGRIHWARSGGEPFTDMAFLVKQLERMNKAANGQPTQSEGMKASSRSN